jgi:hypothetical protein
MPRDNVTLVATDQAIPVADFADAVEERGMPVVARLNPYSDRPIAFISDGWRTSLPGTDRDLTDAHLLIEIGTGRTRADARALNAFASLAPATPPGAAPPSCAPP